MATKKLSVLVVDDTTVYRMILRTIVESIPGVELGGFAANGSLALQKMARLPVDVILLDVEMPVMDGLTTLKHLAEKYPDVTVIMVSGVSHSNANIIVECLSAGALDFITKPLGNDIEHAKKELLDGLTPIFEMLIQKSGSPGKTVKIGKSVETARRVTPPPAIAKKPLPSKNINFRPELVLIGSSTGGPIALDKVLSGFSRKPTIPVLVVQHMPPLFTASLAIQLSKKTGIQVQEGSDGQKIKPGGVILAAGGQHMTVKKIASGMVVKLTDGPKINGCRPAVDMLFMSVAAALPKSILTVILTGMGKDGANGVKALKSSIKTYCITQNKASCVVYGMPRATDELGLSDESIHLDLIGKRISELCF
ncbi:MAG: chemotaxis-specific protein-glutamate methyltransferase CheB [Magnetococcales bacterium]|nr:chemotaxis-specific protein-glutamate methyltransferase CheB [Magnetococcales bacterium]